jgi:hypothetical protein
MFCIKVLVKGIDFSLRRIKESKEFCICVFMLMFVYMHIILSGV